ncbi:helix-turn-helix transcriptional regulator [Vibrio breoganii]
MNETLLSYSDLNQLLNRNYRTIWAWVRDGKFPQPVKMSGRTIGWKKSVVDQWLEEQTQR